MFKITRKETTGAGASSSWRAAGSPARRTVPCWRRLGETVVLATVVASRSVKPGQNFFPLTVNYQEKAFAAGKIPGGFFKREGRPVREGDAHLAPDRPADPAAVPGQASRTRPRSSSPCWPMTARTTPTSWRMVAASAALTISGVPFLGPIGGRPGRLRQRRVHPQPDDRADRKASELDLVVAGTRDAVMMVESEAKELSEETMLAAVMFGHAAVPAGDRPDHRPGAGLRQGAVGPAGGRPRRAACRHEARSRGRACARPTPSPASRRGTRRSTRSRPGRWRAARRRGRRAARSSSPSSSRRWRRDVVRNQILDTGRRIDGRDVEHRAPDRGRRSASCRGSTARRCSPAARPRPCASPRSAPARTSRRSTRSRATCASTTCCTTTSRPTRWARSAAWARRGGARSATASSPGARPGRCCRPRRVPLHHPGRLRGHREQRLVLDGDRLRHLAGADGRRRAAAAAGGRHRHGPDQGGRALRRALRHPRRRGPSGRHGLQGGRHRARRHLAADGHQDRRHHRRDHGDRARARRATGGCTSWARWPRRSGMPRAGDARDRAAGDHDPDPDRQDRRGDRRRRQDDPRDHRADRHQDRHPGRRHGQDRVDRRGGEPARGRLDPRADRQPRGRARSTRARSRGIVDFGAFINLLGSIDGLCHISEISNERVGKVIGRR